MLAVAKGLSRAEIVKHADVLLQAGLAHYGKTHGMVLVDRAGAGYEVGLARVPGHSPEAIAAGAKLFGHRRMKDGSLRLLPEHGDATDV